VTVLGAMNIMVHACLGLWVLLAGKPFTKQIPEKKFQSALAYPTDVYRNGRNAIQYLFPREKRTDWIFLSSLVKGLISYVTSLMRELRKLMKF